MTVDAPVRLLLFLRARSNGFSVLVADAWQSAVCDGEEWNCVAVGALLGAASMLND
jgi:hypothetical protein